MGGPSACASVAQQRREWHMVQEKPWSFLRDDSARELVGDKA